jgi:hypothetical protein
MTAHVDALWAQFGRGEVAAGLLSVISVLLLAFPTVGLCYVLVLTGRMVVRLAVTSTRKHPARRFARAARRCWLRRAWPPTGACYRCPVAYRFATDSPARGRYVLIWLTKLPADGHGRYAEQIYNVIIRGTR